MIAYIKRMPDSMEFILVMLLAFGWFSYVSIESLQYYFDVVEPIDTISSDDSGLYSIVIYELFAGALIAFILGLRGWRIKDFNCEITLFLTLMGVVLMFIDYYLFVSAYYLVFEPVIGDYTAVYAEDAGQYYKNGLLAVTILSIVNPIFEEVLVVAYVHLALSKRFSFIMVMNISVIIRLMYHLYQGPIAFVSILPMGILYYYVYAKYQKLWPLIVSHAILDFWALS